MDQANSGGSIAKAAVATLIVDRVIQHLLDVQPGQPDCGHETRTVSGGTLELGGSRQPEFVRAH